MRRTRWHACPHCLCFAGQNFGGPARICARDDHLVCVALVPVSHEMNRYPLHQLAPLAATTALDSLKSVRAMLRDIELAQWRPEWNHVGDFFIRNIKVMQVQFTYIPIPFEKRPRRMVP